MCRHRAVGQVGVLVRSGSVSVVTHTEPLSFHHYTHSQPVISSAAALVLATQLDSCSAVIPLTFAAAKQIMETYLSIQGLIQPAEQQEEKS